MPAFSYKLVQELISPAFTIAILAGIESLLSAVVSDGMIGDTHKSNAELIGQGLGNIFSGLFGGIPATGAIARTAANVRNGGRTPIAGITHCITLSIILVVLMPLCSPICNVYVSLPIISMEILTTRLNIPNIIWYVQKHNSNCFKA